MENPEDILGFTPEGSGEYDPTKIDKNRQALPPVVRGDRFSVADWRDSQKMIRFMNNMRTVPIEAIDDQIVNDSYAAAVWLFRKAAVDGDLKATTAMEKWLAWAKPILNKQKDRPETPTSPGSVAFMPRVPKENDVE